MTYVQPPVGSRVRVTVEGTVEESHAYSMQLTSGLYLEWDEDGATPPSVQILAPDFRMGDVGSYRNSSGEPRTVFYMCLPGRSSGWYNAQGTPVHFDTNQHPEMVVRYDGALVKEIVR
jgi:hypothetical protein